MSKVSKVISPGSSVLGTPGLPALYAMALLMSSGFAVQSFAAVFHLADVHGAGAGVIGRAVGTQGIAYILGCFLFPFLRRREGLSQDFRILFLAAPVLAGLTILFYYVPTVGAATIILAGTGFATALLWPPMMGVVSSLAEGSGLNRVMARYNLSWTLGSVLMPMAAGALYMHSVLSTFSVAALLFAGGGIIYLFFFIFRVNAFHHAGSVRSSSDTREITESGSTEDERTTREHRLTGWIMLFADHVVSGLLIFILPLSLRTDSGLNEISVGAVVFARSIVMASGMWAFGHLDFWHFNRKAAPAMVALYILFITAMVLFRGVIPVYFIAIALTGLPTAFFYSSGVFHGVSGSTNRSRRMAVSEAVMTCGLFIGAALGGMLYQAMGIRIALAAAGGVLILGTVIMFLVIRIVDMSAISIKETTI